MNNRIFFGLLFLAAAVTMVWFAFKGQSLPFNLTEKTSSTSPTISVQIPQELPGNLQEGSGQASGLDKGGVSVRSVVTYTDSGFGPTTLEVSVGSTVTFVNESSRGMWVASAVHPTHQLLPGFDQLSQVSRGGTYEYTFARIGTWKYHNHQNPADTATIVVK